MPTNKEKLQSLRQEIDAIDSSILELIMARTRVVQQVRLVKHEEIIKIRPAREAEILYRLLARHKGPFPKQELARIWRELIVATLRLEGPFSVAVFVGENETGYWDLARDQYGSFTPTARHNLSKNVLEAVRTRQATVGILPMPQSNDANFWWLSLLSEDPNPLRIMARLPFIPGDNSSQLRKLDALVISTIPQEKTGRDHSYLSIEAREDIGFNAIEKMMSQAGFTIVFQQQFHDPDHSETWVYLIEVDDFINNEGDQLKHLKNKLTGNIIRILHLGGYATPLEPLEIKTRISDSFEKQEPHE